MNILILNGPNLNLLGVREPHKYGNLSLTQINEKVDAFAKTKGVKLEFFQSNIEGQIINAIQNANSTSGGIVLNAGGYTHTSVAIGDAISAISIPVIEVHISNVAAREDFRQISHIGAVSSGSISGFGWRSYIYGIQALLDLQQK
jgi:3-dehydroquinate dehydratase II